MTQSWSIRLSVIIGICPVRSMSFVPRKWLLIHLRLVRSNSHDFGDFNGLASCNRNLHRRTTSSLSRIMRMAECRRSPT